MESLPKLKNTSKIEVIYEGFNIVNKKSQDIELPEKFLLYIGNAYPHKNLKFLLKVFKKFLKSNKDYYLILIGSEDHFYKELRKDINSNIIIKGFILKKKTLKLQLIIIKKLRLIYFPLCMKALVYHL